MKKIKNIMLLLAIIMLIAGLICIGLGFYKILNYHNSNYSTINVYVGGDAYNYIINGTYFSGYVSLGGNLIATSAILIAAWIGLKIKEN
ncbi:MAG: hypothetical protein EGQ16_02520 [Clostridiales bacterium]|nr:hypothetical protein [Clostridiales bacterium]